MHMTLFHFVTNALFQSVKKWIFFPTGILFPLTLTRLSIVATFRSSFCRISFVDNFPKIELKTFALAQKSISFHSLIDSDWSIEERKNNKLKAMFNKIFCSVFVILCVTSTVLCGVRDNESSVQGSLRKFEVVQN
jgi:hypothetical protein